MCFRADMLKIGVNPEKGSVKIAESDGEPVRVAGLAHDAGSWETFG